MNVGNFLSPGQFAIAVPQGIPTTLQYNEEGRLERMYYGYEPEKWRNITEVIAHTIMTENVVPVTISIKGGTTWVYGVLYTHELVSDSGNLPECVLDTLLNKFVSNSEDFSFVAGGVKSLGTQFRGAAPSRQWLQLSGYNLLPGKLVPAVNAKDVINVLFNNVYFPYRFPLLSHIIVYVGKDIKFYEFDLSQFVISRVSKKIDPNGFILGELSLTDGSQMTVDYSAVVHWNLHPNTCIVVDNDMNSSTKIVYAFSTDNKKRDVRPSRISCSVCGNLIDVPDHGFVRCSDPHCLSRVYEAITQMLHVFKLPELSYADYSKLVKNGLITCLSDVLILPEYKDLKIEATLSTVLRALVSYLDIGNDDVFFTFASSCNNSLETALYFLNHPDRISSMGVLHNSIHTPEFIEWASDPVNVQEFQAVCESVTFVGLGKKFNGAPIFRGKKIFITGKFQHGNHEEIASIFRSYGAEVVTTFSYREIVPNEDQQTHISNICMVVGDLMEDVDGQSVRIARKNHIPVFNESGFFKEYDIDKDLAENL